MVSLMMRVLSLALVALPAAVGDPAPQATRYTVTEGDYLAHDFQFKSGEKLAELRLHYRTLGKPVRDASGQVSNAVLILHGTGGSGAQFLQPQFADELFGAGQLLDAGRYYIILPDGIGHGKSSKPSDGAHAHFPQYDYDDMVAAQHLVLEEGLQVRHLRLILGTSMGCMHSFLWAESFPGFMDALMPMACLPVPIAGRNRVWRKMAMDAIREDPEWKQGEYQEQPRAALRAAQYLLVIAGSAAILMQKNCPTREAADQYVADVEQRALSLDANDLLYQLNASRNYDPSPQLENITVPVMWINSFDDFINPPELGIAEKQAQRLKNGTFILLRNEQTHGHGTHTWAVFWKPYLQQILEPTAR
jgi:homoserine O-acetyltransferase